MDIELSEFAQRFGRDSGARRLMDDLGAGMAADQEMLMLGGGNPSHIAGIDELFRARMQELVDDPDAFAAMIGNYDAPQGNQAFVAALAELLQRQYGWAIGPQNIALTAGSQTSFFLLFNMLAGAFSGGHHKRILLPMTPEYIGYADVGLSDDLFAAQRPRIEHLADRYFKYHIDFSQLEVADDIGAICVSRPTNPSGNVLTDSEMAKLVELARSHQVPLIIDNAYGAPFPHIVFTEITPIWEEHVVLCMSLSKLGLPGTRTGIVIADEAIIDAITGMNAVISLAVGSVGAVLAHKLVASGQIIEVSRNLITPHYQQRAHSAVTWLQQALNGCQFHIHKPEGAIFLWLWLPGLPISSDELYQRLKARHVLVLPGHYFFSGLDEDWAHKHECLRITYSQEPAAVQRGIEIIGEEVKRAFAQG